MACAVECAKRGHDVTLFDKNDEIGGQFNYAKVIPGKEEFHETIRFYKNQLTKNRVKLSLGNEVDFNDLKEGFNHIVVSTGVRPRKLDIEGIEHPKVKNYMEAIKKPNELGNKVAVIGAGGIGFDVSELLSHKNYSKEPQSIKSYLEEWGIDSEYTENRGGLNEEKLPLEEESRKIYLLQRKTTAHGKALEKQQDGSIERILKRGEWSLLVVFRIKKLMT